MKPYWILDCDSKWECGINETGEPDWFKVGLFHDVRPVSYFRESDVAILQKQQAELYSNESARVWAARKMIYELLEPRATEAPILTLLHRWATDNSLLSVFDRKVLADAAKSIQGNGTLTPPRLAHVKRVMNLCIEAGFFIAFPAAAQPKKAQEAPGDGDLANP